MSLELAINAMPPSEAVVTRVADIEGVEPTDLEPLFETIDPDALDAVVESASGPDGSGFRIEFTYHGHEVAVTDGGVVHIEAAPTI